ncbi:MAG TPA: HNH endonuclease [Chitinophagaceae bacterium]|nr:HNH endonuclease [Chitinophagaceae bacterium]
MKKGQKLWTREELILTINLYCKTPFGKLHNRNPEIVKLAEVLDRSPSSVSYKLVNFASFDPSLQKRGIKGAENASKLDKAIWDEFFSNLEDLAFESEKTLAQREGRELTYNEKEPSKSGEDTMRLMKSRVNQGFFRRMLMASYDSKCCITGIDSHDLLIASHIVPWSEDKNNRLNPRNGLLLNALHDRAFENGLIGIDSGFRIRISSTLKGNRANESIKRYFHQYENNTISFPSRFMPDQTFLKNHLKNRFIV